MIAEALETIAFRERLLAERAIPAGAYADAGNAHYLFVAPGRVYARSHEIRNEALQAVSDEIPAFSWDEREMASERSVRFEGLPDDRPLHAYGGRMPDAIVAEGSGVVRFVVGPVHAGVIEPGRFTFSSGGETVVHLDVQLGYSYRAVERKLEGSDALGAAWSVGRICGGCSAARSFAYARALEELASVAIDEKVELTRVFAAESERIMNHLGDLAAASSGAGYSVGFTRGMTLKERAMRMNLAAFGHRLLFDAIVPGGVTANALSKRGWLAGEIDDLQSEVTRYVADLFANSSLISRWRGTGIVTRDIAQAFGAVGPAARASGAGFDVRTIAAYGAYPSLSLVVAAETSGDAFGRCRIKADELSESFRLLRSSLHALAGRSLPPNAEPVLRPGTALSAVEGPRGMEVVAVRVDEHGRLGRFHAISASYRNWPIIARAMEGNIVPDFPLVNKSFNLCYACADR